MELKEAIVRAKASNDVQTLVASGAFLCSAYVIINKDEPITSWTLSYCTPDTKIVPVAVTADSVNVGESGEPVREKKFTALAEPQVNEKNALQRSVQKADEMQFRYNKIIISVQRNGLQYWSVTFLTAGGEALNVRIDSSTGEVLYAEKSSILQKTG